MALAKLQITVVHTGDVITAQFNPEEYTVNRLDRIGSHVWRYFTRLSSRRATRRCSPSSPVDIPMLTG